MIREFRSSPIEDAILIMWIRPKYEPEKYNLAYSCKLKHDVTDYIPTTSLVLDSRKVHHTIPDLRQDSICTISLLAVYNPASIDSGITIKGKTSEEGKAKCMPFLAISLHLTFLATPLTMDYHVYRFV